MTCVFGMHRSGLECFGVSRALRAAWFPLSVIQWHIHGGIRTKTYTTEPRGDQAMAKIHRQYPNHVVWFPESTRLQQTPPNHKIHGEILTK